MSKFPNVTSIFPTRWRYCIAHQEASWLKVATAHLVCVFVWSQSFNVLRHNVHFSLCQSINLYFYTCQTFSNLKIKYIWNGRGIKGEMIYCLSADSAENWKKRTCFDWRPTTAMKVCCRLTICMLGKFSFLFCRLLILFFFSKSTFSKNYFGNTTREANGLDPDQDRQNVGSDLGPNCLQRLSADDKRRRKQGKC